MPIGIQRLNARRLPPNERIIFIKPLDGPDKACAQDFLERIAAICVPIMRQHHLSIMTLEEYEPNREFVGRNFNAGEVIQLVLKAPFTGHWLPFRYVQMVMMHELAHCVQMNHSRAFWAVRNNYADELRGLWSKEYTGEGMWSRGRTVAESDGRHVIAVPETEMMPRSLCGGTYRSRRRKRRRAGGSEGQGGQKLTYAERQQRRIAKKFGTNGVTLGDDEDTRIELERGRIVKGKPRVAGSARGRELRAAAALKRFGEQVKEESRVKKEEEEAEEETDSEVDEDEEGNGESVIKEEEEEALDWNGRRLLDAQGHGMVKICEEEDVENPDVLAEMRELQQVEYGVGSERGHGREQTRIKPDPDEDCSTGSRSLGGGGGRGGGGGGGGGGGIDGDAAVGEASQTPQSIRTTIKSEDDFHEHNLASIPPAPAPAPAPASVSVLHNPRPLHSPPSASASASASTSSIPTASPLPKTLAQPLPFAKSSLSARQNIKTESPESKSTPGSNPDSKSNLQPESTPESEPPKTKTEPDSTPQPHLNSKTKSTSRSTSNLPQNLAPNKLFCPICSLANPVGSLTCLACAHVLDLGNVPDHWRCKSPACGGGEYVNAGDCGRCGICGARREELWAKNNFSTS